MSTKSEKKPASIGTEKMGRLSLHRESLKDLTVRTGVKTGLSLTCTPTCYRCDPVSEQR